MDADQLELFAAILFAARSSGPRELKERWLQGWRPKQPDAEEVAVGEFLNSLTSEQKALVIQAVTHFVDASFFKLIVSLEDGEGPAEFMLSMTDTSTGQETTLIGPDEDVDLKHLFFRWRRLFGGLE